MPQLKLGFEVVRSYKRLSYTPWYALAEFIDNSTESYFANRKALDRLYRESGDSRLVVQISYDRDSGQIVVRDNAMGMDLDELERALVVGSTPKLTTGRSRYGMGMKTAACWLGDVWTVRTKKLGSDVELTVRVDVEAVASGNNELPYSGTKADPKEHYTALEITHLNRPLHGRTIGKIRDYLASMYRRDIRAGDLTLLWQGESLAWDEERYRLLTDDQGKPYRQEFSFEVDGKRVSGWAGVLERGSRAKAGFSILHSGRVVKGWPESWRPQTIFGQVEGSNDLVNQRLVGEVNLDDFDVSHTKDDILWIGTEQDRAEASMREELESLIQVAKTSRRGRKASAPTRSAFETAIAQFNTELRSAAFGDQLRRKGSIASEGFAPLVKMLRSRPPDFSAREETQELSGYFISDMAASGPYAIGILDQGNVVILINAKHPQVRELRDAQGVLNHLRHAVYDVLASRETEGLPDGAAFLFRKDQLLRTAARVEQK